MIQSIYNLQVAARDVDAGINSVVVYNLSSDTFAVESFTGLIRTTASLDRENVQTYVLTVTAYNIRDSNKTANCSGDW